MSEKIGLGLITYNRPEYFKKSFNSIPLYAVDEIVIVNDGTPYGEEIHVPHIQHKKNMGVGISKNDALKHLLNKGCDFIFLMEDDIIIKNPEVFQTYIKTYKETGIHHFNYSQHGLMNKRPNSNIPAPKNKIEYSNSISIELYPHCVGAFSFYTKKCLENVGFIDESFHNALEHVEHTYQIIQKNMHPPFWWFADISNSNEYLTDIPWSPETSTISSKSNHNQNFTNSLLKFKKKHNKNLLEMVPEPLDNVKLALKQIYKLK
jgi:glycosyltransferase involved in cell wall biosynthesis